MSNAPPKTQHASGPVWCENRRQSAVVTLVTPVAEAGPPYIQWCSLVGTSIDCDESCVHRAAKWVGDETRRSEGAGLPTYDRVRAIVVQVRETIEQTSVELASWVDWARAFAAGICSEPRAWHAAEEASHAASKVDPDSTSYLVVMAAADAAWAAVHTAAGNVSLALESTSRAHQLLKAAGAARGREPDNSA